MAKKPSKPGMNERWVPKKPDEKPKMKRLTLYPKNAEGEEKGRSGRRWVPTKEKPDMKAPERLPYYKDLQPKYAPAQPGPLPPAQPPAPQMQPTPVQAQPQPDSDITGPIIFFIVFLGALFIFILPILEDGGLGGKRECIKRATGGAFGSMPLKPSCSDTTSSVMATYVNGKYIGDMSYASVPCYYSGDSTPYRCS